MAKLATPKKSTKPAAPKKPSTRSKTGNKACSDAASNWQLSLRGKSPLNPDTYQTLAKCRAMASTHRKADAYGRTGKLSDQGAAALRGRAQKRFDSNLITEKSRRERLQTLLSERAAKRGTAAAKTAPSKPAGVQRVLKGTTTKTDLNSGNYAAELKRKVDSHLAAGGSVSVNTMTRSTPITRPGDAGVLQVKGSSIYIAQGKSSGALVGSTLDNLAGQVGMPPRSMVPELRGTEPRRQLAAKKFAERKKDRDMKTRGSQARMERAAFLREVRAGRQAAAKPSTTAAKPQSAAAKSAAKNPWEMTREEFLAPKIAKYPNAPQMQRDAWASQYDEQIRNAPRDAKIPLRVLESLPESQRKAILKTNAVASKQWDEEGPQVTWRMTYRDMLKDVKDRTRVSDIRGIHRKAVSDAIREGKQVPANVLADYPDLKPPVPHPANVPKAAPYSLGGKLAPGRGTEERKQAAKDKWQDRPRRFLNSETYLTQSGEPFHVMTKRFGVLRAFPYKDGKPFVNRDSGVMFAVTDSAKLMFPEYRTDLTNRPMKPVKNKLSR